MRNALKTLTAAIAALTLLSGGSAILPSSHAADSSADVVGGANFMCALAVLGGIVSAVSVNLPGAVVSAAGIAKFC
jgi:hypothetical protein